MLILAAGLVLVTTAYVFFIDKNERDNALQMSSLFGQELAERLVDSDGNLYVPQDINKMIEYRKKDYNIDECNIVITDADGALLKPIEDPRSGRLITKTDIKSIAQEPHMYATVTPVLAGEQKVGQIFIVQEIKPLFYSFKENGLWFIAFVGLLILGWFTIYLLSRKLSRPIREVASAARLVSHGQYSISLDENAKEKEIAELVVSFKEMAQKLKQSEEWRAVMLAGVTHELKTPITSIKGLVYAVLEDVVAGEEKQEFLDIALKEADRMQVMIDDLLDYNAFAIGSVDVMTENINAGQLIEEIVYQWNLVQAEREFELEVDIPNESFNAVGDSSRIQQILINLLNNSVQARRDGQRLQLKVSLNKRADGVLAVEIADNGTGIPLHEQPHLFERFYRGETNKLRRRGLGLGLTFSRMLAHAMGGNLELVESSAEGTRFRLTLAATRDES